MQSGNYDFFKFVSVACYIMCEIYFVTVYNSAVMEATPARTKNKTNLNSLQIPNTSWCGKLGAATTPFVPSSAEPLPLVSESGPNE